MDARSETMEIASIRIGEVDGSMDDSATCYHEAGHAVIGYLLGGDVESMALGGEPDEVLPARFGDCRIRWSAKNVDLLSQSGREAMTLLAGPVAERRRCGRAINVGTMANRFRVRI
jgi:hypothetical protein